MWGSVVFGTMVDEAGFERVRSGDVRPWIHYAHGVKP
jgi:hypothetical protein